MAIPATYRALQLSTPGPVTNFAVKQLPTRMPGPGEVLVKVQACAVAYRDVLDRTGAFKFIRQPTVLGHEFAGTIVACGDNATRAVGDRVVSLHWDQQQAWPSPLNKTGAVDSMFALSCDGGYAEYVTAPVGAFVRAPEHMSSAAAACVMSTFGTVWCGAVTRAGLTGDHRLLVTGVSGGVGSAAALIGKALGCRVTAVTSSPAKVDAIREVLGVHECVVADDGKFKTKAPADVVLEAVGGPTFASSLRATAPGGKLVVVGNVTNATVQLPLGYCILNSISVVGSDSILASDFEENMLPFLARHKLQPVVARTMPLEAAGEAHRALEQREALGRYVLQISDEW